MAFDQMAAFCLPVLGVDFDGLAGFETFKGCATQKWRNSDLLVNSRESERRGTQVFALFELCISPIMKEALTRKDENWGAVR